ncbi:MAG: hypothetical protein RIB71_23110 [Imperialibacter sp.]|uniref:hypothetical protein n=1 Tax=Imperialibacter sp. TaxID=2038411 RepID=UPI0032EB2188
MKIGISVEACQLKKYDVVGIASPIGAIFFSVGFQPDAVSERPKIPSRRVAYELGLTGRCFSRNASRSPIGAIFFSAGFQPGAFSEHPKAPSGQYFLAMGFNPTHFRCVPSHPISINSIFLALGFNLALEISLIAI